MSSQSVLEVDDLYVSFSAPRSAGRSGFWARPRVKAVDGVSLSVDRGELVALVGESGSGKTTTAQGILRLVEPSAGTIRLGEVAVSTASKRQLRKLRTRMQIVYQDPYEALDPRCRVRAIVEEPILIHKLAPSTAARQAMACDALAKVGLTPPELFLERYPHELSGGQRQRVAIAASLTLKPDLLILDEPVSMLDVSVRASILGLFTELRTSGLAILMITHDLTTVAHYADRVAVMYLGRIVEEGATEAVITNPQHPYTKALLSVVPTLVPEHARPRQILNDDIPDPLHIPTGCRFRTRCPQAQAVCAGQDPSLKRIGDDDHQVACLLVP